MFDNNGAGYISSAAFSCGYTENKKNFKFSKYFFEIM